MPTIKLIPYYVILLILLTVGCTPKEKYLASPNGQYHLTFFDDIDSIGKSYTFIAYGKIEAKKISNNYIKVRNRYTDAWHCLITWQGNKLIIYQPYSDFTSHHLTDKMELREMSDRQFFEIFFNSKNDHYIRLSSYDKDNL